MVQQVNNLIRYNFINIENHCRYIFSIVIRPEIAIQICE